VHIHDERITTPSEINLSLLSPPFPFHTRTIIAARCSPAQCPLSVRMSGPLNDRLCPIVVVYHPHVYPVPLVNPHAVRALSRMLSGPARRDTADFKCFIEQLCTTSREASPPCRKPLRPLGDQSAVRRQPTRLFRC